MNGRVSIQTRSESVQNAKVPISIDLKKCGCCKKIKSVEEFSKRGKNKRQSNCKLCKSIYAKKYYYDNYNYSINRVKKYYEENKEARKQYSKNYRRENPEAVKIRAKKWLKENPDYYKQHYQVPAVKKNKSEYFKKYCKENPEKRKECVKRRRKKEAKDPMKKLHIAVSTSVRRALKSNKNRITVFKLLGYSSWDLRCHLEKQFTNGMTWENHGLHGWHIDHKIPISAFNFTRPEDIDFKRCWALDNLQPMWAKENLSKGASLHKPFQPSLLL